MRLARWNEDVQGRLLLPGEIAVLRMQRNENDSAWLDGDWSVTLGAFFDCWDSKRHVVRPFEVPAEWMRFRSMDWGSAVPFSVGWWAVVQDDFETDGRVLPRGCLVRYREWYGMTPGQITRRYVVEVPAQLSDEEWEKKYS